MSTVKKHLLADLTYAALLSAAVFGLGMGGWTVFQGFRHMQAVAAPVSEWVTVEDFSVTGAQEVRYAVGHFSREVSLDIQNHWNASVIDQATGITMCKGEGVSNMLIDKPKVFTHYLPEWINDPDCDLPEGAYQLQVYWVLSDFTGVTKTLTLESNVFEIS